jgi:hypothetical protein
MFPVKIFAFHKVVGKVCEIMKIAIRGLIASALLSSTFVLLCGISSCKNTISGTVKGDAVQGVEMELSGDASRIIKTSVNGKYKFRGLEKGSYTITPSKKGYLFFPKSRSVRVDKDRAGIDFASGAGMDSISGASIKPF